MTAPARASDSPTALIAEDEALLAAGLRAELAALWPELRIAAMPADGFTALADALRWQPRVCFLDIRMPALDGLQVAEALAEDWPDGPGAPPFPLLVFITAYDQYAVQAFERQAVDYLLKPVAPARLARTVQRLQSRLAAPAAGGQAAQLDAAVQQLRALMAEAPSGAASAPRLEMIQAASGATLHLVPVDEVLYFEAADRYVRVMTAEREHLIRLSLRELLPQLDPQRFWQVHRGTVVQARAIASATRDEAGRLILSLRQRPERLTVSRLYAHLFKGM